MPSDIVRSLEQASRDLLFPSESDFPFEVIYWEGNFHNFDSKELLRLAGHSLDSPVENEELDHLFQGVIKEEEWNDESERQTVRKHQHLLQTLKTTLTDIKVFRVGKIGIFVYIIGKTPSGGLAGIKTRIVET